MANKKNLPLSHEIIPNVYRITLPLLGQKPGPVNVFLFLGNCITLLDTGTSPTVRRLKRALSQHEIDFADIDQIILTHGHPDHYGAANRVVRASKNKTRVALHEDDMMWVETGFEAPLKNFAVFYSQAGIPSLLRGLMRSLDITYKAAVKPLRIDAALKDGDELAMGDYQGRVISTPGHSKGSICIYLEEESVLFCGDTVLAHITPNAFVMLEEDSPRPVRSSQVEYYDSLSRIEGLSPALTCPAHGKMIPDLNEVLKGYRRSYLERQEKILSIIDSEELSIYQIARRLFPDVEGARLLMEIYSMISEVYTHLQVLQAEGRAAWSSETGVIRVASC